MKIGNNIELGDRPLFLAPMEDVTDPSFRYICKSYGADVMYTEFISSDALIRDAKQSLKKLEFSEAERPIGIQIYGHLKDALVEAAKIAESVNPDIVDINFGCPVKKIAGRGAGSGMMRYPDLMVEITEAVVKAVKLPVTVKTRLGFDDENKNIFELAERLQDIGIQALTIHGRTRSQMYKGNADWDLIGKIKNNPRMHIPIIGNGDVTSAEIAAENFNRYGVDGIMIGRATFGRPWIFNEIKQYFKTGLPPVRPCTRDIVDLAREHFLKSVDYKGPKGGILEMRRHFSQYFKGLVDFKDTRIKLITSLDVEEILAILNSISEQYGDFVFTGKQTTIYEKDI